MKSEQRVNSENWATRWLKSRCLGCDKLQDARDQDAFARCELTNARDKLAETADTLEETRQTNINLGAELDRKGQEISAAEQEIGMLRKRVGLLEDDLRAKGEECARLRSIRADLIKELNAYQAVAVVRQQIEQPAPLKSRSNKRQSRRHR